MNNNPLIETAPTNWKDLQNSVCRILLECGYNAETEKTIETARGQVNVDVYAIDTSRRPHITFIVECKYWASSVPKTIIHAFRSVVSDFGANVGYVVSAAGFQSGAYDAAVNSPIKLLTWEEFQREFVNQWIENYFIGKVAEAVNPLIEYTEPINSRIFNKADNLLKERKDEFKALRKKYFGLGMLAVPLSIKNELFDTPPIELPLRARKKRVIEMSDIWLPDELLDASTFRDFLKIISKHSLLAIAEFVTVHQEH